MKNLISILFLTLFLFGIQYAQDTQKLKVMTFNIHHGQGIDGKIDIKRISDLIKDNKADLAALQEIDRGVERSGKIDIVRLLEENTGMTMAFAKNIDFQGGDYGNGILSGFKIDTVKNRHYKMIREGEQRGLLQTIVEIDGEKILFMNTHTGDKNNETEKLMNVDEILTVLKEYQGMPVILCGDFNDRPGSRMHESMKQCFVDVWEMLNIKEGYSFPSVNPDRRIDYIYISKDALKKLKPVSIKVIQSQASDHLPVAAEFEILSKE